MLHHENSRYDWGGIVKLENKFEALIRGLRFVIQSCQFYTKQRLAVSKLPLIKIQRNGD